MKTLFARTLLMATACGVVLSPHAQENLLWKTTNSLPAVVVVPYSGTGSPFPKTFEARPESTDALDEQARLRDEAYTAVRDLMNSGRALQPAIQTILVGGMVEGNLGRKLLINNQWLGVGGKLLVRQYKSAQVEDALKTLAQYDPAAYQELSTSLNSNLAANPTVPMQLESITSQTLVLKGPGGRSTVRINTNPQY